MQDPIQEVAPDLEEVAAMVPHVTRDAEDAAIRADVDAIVEAVRAKDINAFLSRCAPDIVAFDLLPPLVHVGMTAVRRAWDAALGAFQGLPDYEVSDLHVAVDGDVAFCHGLTRFGGTRKDGKPVATWLRSTMAFRKIAFAMWTRLATVAGASPASAIALRLSSACAEVNWFNGASSPKCSRRLPVVWR